MRALAILILFLPLLLSPAAQALDSLPLPDYALAYQEQVAPPPLTIVAGDGRALTIDRPGRLGQQQLTTQLGERGWQRTSLDHSVALPLPQALRRGVLRNVETYATTGVAMARADDAYNLARQLHYGGGLAYAPGARLGMRVDYDNTVSSLPGTQTDRAERMNVNLTYRF